MAAGTGARWSVVAAGAAQASTVVSTVVASRLLTPAEFAIVAATTVMASLYAIVSAAGFGTAALVGDRDDEDANATLFWGAAGLGSAVFLLAALTAPLAARLIGETGATATIRVAALAIPFSMMASVVQNVFFRRLRYGVAYTVDIVTAAVTAIGPVVLLAVGWGPWGVILPRTLAAVATLVVIIAVGRWLPRRTVDRAYLRTSSRFSARIMALNVAHYAQGNLDYWVVGRVVSTAAFGAYYLAFVVPSILRQRATWTINGLVTPLMVRVRHDPEALGALYQRAVRATGALVIPVLVGAAVTADLVIRVAFGPQWGAAVTPLRIMAIMAAIDVSSQLTNPVFMALQRPGDITRRVVVQTVSLAVALVPVLFVRTIEAAAWASLAAVVVGASFSQVQLHRAIRHRMADVVRALAPTIVAASVMAASVLAYREVAPSLAAVAELAACTAIGAAFHLATLRLAFPGSFHALAADVRGLRSRTVS